MFAQTMNASPQSTAPAADKAALTRIGASVRDRLSADPAAYRIDTDQAELFVIADFLSESECNHFIAMIDDVAVPSKRFDPENPVQYRTSYSGDLDPEDNFVRMIERRMADLMGMDPAWAESIQGQRYQPGQEFHAHWDYFDTTAPYWKDATKRGGQRSWTAMVYLNTVEEGGETDFPMIGISIPPQRGVLVIWNNMRPDGTPNLMTHHAGKPVLQGTKYIFTKWFRARKWA